MKKFDSDFVIVSLYDYNKIKMLKKVNLWMEKIELSEVNE